MKKLTYKLLVYGAKRLEWALLSSSETLRMAWYALGNKRSEWWKKTR